VLILYLSIAINDADLHSWHLEKQIWWKYQIFKLLSLCISTWKYFYVT